MRRFFAMFWEGILRKFLDRLYGLCGALSAAIIVAICLLVTSQVVLNLVSRLAGTAFNVTIPSYSSISGYMLACASFLAMSYTLMKGGHIRVTLFIGRFNSPLRLAAELFSLALAFSFSGFATYYMINLTRQSLRFGDLSSGMLAIPIWIPQSVVSFGLVVLTIALADLFVQTIQRGEPAIQSKEVL